MGKTVHVGSSFDYRSSGATGSYVRAEIAGLGGTTYTNPFGFSSVDAVADTDDDELPDWWELAYFGSLTSAVATARTPSGMTVIEHYIAGSDPHDSDAGFRIVHFDICETEPSRMRLRWPSAAGRVYVIKHALELTDTFTPVAGAEALVAVPPYNEYDVDVSEPRGLYRIDVRLAN